MDALTWRNLWRVNQFRFALVVTPRQGWPHIEIDLRARSGGRAQVTRFGSRRKSTTRPVHRIGFTAWQNPAATFGCLGFRSTQKRANSDPRAGYHLRRWTLSDRLRILSEIPSAYLTMSVLITGFGEKPLFRYASRRTNFSLPIIRKIWLSIPRISTRLRQI